MARIVVTSDLHYDDEVDLTPPATVAALAGRIASHDPDVVVIAGDLGHPIRNFQGCLSLFTQFPVPVGVVAGNHDIWRDPDGRSSSDDLFLRALPSAVRDAGMAWLEEDTIVVGRTAVVGSLIWYDYSAVDPSLSLSLEQLAELKQHATNDSIWIDLPWTDRGFAARLRRGLEARLDALEWDADIDHVVLVTHVPLFEEQMVRRTDEASWGLIRAYFGNFTTGEAVTVYSKLRAVVSGHTHRRVHARPVERPGLPPLPVYTVGSDYGEPASLVVETAERLEERPLSRIRPSGPPWID